MNFQAPKAVAKSDCLLDAPVTPISHVNVTECEEEKRTFDQAIVFFRKNAIDFSDIKKWDRGDLYE